MKRALACPVALLASTIIALGQEVVCSLGGFVGPASMKENLKNSSAVVYGDVDARVPRGGGNVKFSLHVVEVLSGSLTSDSTLNVSYKQFAGCFGPDYEAKENGIWFLSEQAGTWTALPVQQNPLGVSGVRFPAVRPLPADWIYSPSAAVEDKLASEIAASLEQQGAGGLDAGTPDDRVLYLDELESSLTDRVYDRMANSSSSYLQAHGLAALIRKSRYSALEQVVKNAPQYVSDIDVIDSIKGFYRSADPKSVELLGNLAIDPGADPKFRDAAVFALHGMHTEATIPYLVKLFDDFDLGAWAISGIELYAMGSPMQTPDSSASLAHMQYSGQPSQEMFANFELGPGAVNHKEYWRKWLNQQGLAQ